MPAPTPLSGDAVEIRSGDRSAVVTQLGATLRQLRVAGTDLLDGFGPDGYPGPPCYGQVLAPWPGRIEGGRYAFDDVAHQLPLDDLRTGSAIHGLVRWLTWEVTERSADAVALRCLTLARDGYPFVLEHEQRYAWRGPALEVRSRATNLGPTAAPYGYGLHVYFALTPRVDATVLEVPARSWIHEDDDLIPRLPPDEVEGTPFDFRQGRPVGDTVLDTGYCDLERDADGWARVRLSAPDGPEVVCAQDESLPFLQVFSGDTLAPERRRRGLAVEPYTCPADAFNHGLGLVRLEPGASFQTGWSVAVS